MNKTVTKKKPSSSLLRVSQFLLPFLLLGALVVFLLPRWGGALIQSRLSKITNLPLEVGELDFSLLRPQFSIQRLQFSNPKGFPAAPLAQIGKVKVSYFPPALLVWRLDLKRVEIDFKEFRLVRNEKGNLNLPLLSLPRAGGDKIDELVLNLGPLTYTDLSGGAPAQKTFDLGLKSAVYRNVKGVAGIIEILNWEILKRTGVEEEKAPTAPPQMRPIVESPVAGQTAPPPAQRVLPESSPSPPAPPPAPSAQEADELKAIS